MSWIKNSELVFYCDYSNGDEWIFRLCITYENTIYGEWPDGTLIRIHRDKIWRLANVDEQKEWWTARLTHYAPINAKINAKIQEANNELAKLNKPLKRITDHMWLRTSC